MIKGHLEEPRLCRKCNVMTMNFFLGRIKRRDWICKPCHIRDRQAQFVKNGHRKYLDPQTAVISGEKYIQEVLF